MDEMKFNDSYLAEDKRSLGIAGAFSGYIMTLLLWFCLLLL